MVIFIDCDDTLIRQVGSKRIPCPEVVKWIEAHWNVHDLYLWSKGGADYALKTADELGLSHCFMDFYSKPDKMIDDRFDVEVVHPFNVDLI